VGGVEEYLSLLLPALHAAGAEVAFWHETDEPRDRSPIPMSDGVQVFCAADVGVDESLRRLRAWAPDVVYVQGLGDVRNEGKLLDIAPALFFLHTYIGTCISGTKAFSRPTAMPCSRTFGPACLVQYFPHGCGGNSPMTMVRLYREQSERLRTLRRYHSIVTHTDHMRQEMQKHGVPARVIPYPVEAKSDVPRTPGGGPWRLLFAGRMEALKGGHILIDALPDVAAAAECSVRVTFAGDGRERARWEARASRIQASATNLTIEFLGWLPQGEIGGLMRNADLLVVPSLWPEPFGAVGPAAAHHGLPAAAFASGGIGQWLVDGVTGHLAPADPPTASGLARAIVRSLRDPAHYAALRAGAQKKAEQFTMARHLPALIETLEDVARSRAA
jgi:glycosyltransferase involved in cell wall biosynthesis